jgi:hypothetical protein
MDYENRTYNYSEKLPIRERNYSYFMINNRNNRNIKENVIPDHYPTTTSYNKNHNNDNNNLISSNMRMSNIEIRLNTMEKMMKYFDEFIHLKEEEKLNNINSLELSANIPQYLNDLLNKVDKLEKEINNLKKQKQISDIEHAKTIENLNNKIQFLEKIVTNNNDIDNDMIFEMSNKNQKLDKDLSMMKNKKNNLEFEAMLQNKLNEIYSNNKISEMLGLIEDINKIAEDNEFNINEQNENIRKIQNDNLTLIKIVSVHSEKINNIDYILNELNILKNKYFKLLSIINNDNNEKEEEEKFTNEFIAKYKVDNNQIDDNNNDNDNKDNNDNNNEQ